MTAEHSRKRIIKKPLTAIRGLGLCYMCLFIVILFFKNSTAASEWVSSGLKICATRLIPSLFPFMVLSSLALGAGVGRLVPKAVQVLFFKLFGVGADGATAIFLGWLCGFPVGAKCAADLYENDTIDEGEYKKLVCISSTPSPAFLIGAVGSGMLGSAALGASLYAISLISSVAVGIFLGRTVRSSSPERTRSSRKRRISFSEIFTKAVSESAIGMLNICAFVIFFSAFLGVLGQSLSFLSLSDTAESLMFAVFELTSGLSRICSLPLPVSFPLCALAVGWSGLSVHFQTFSVCSRKPLGKSTYFLTHLLRAALCFAIAWTLSIIA